MDCSKLTKAEELKNYIERMMHRLMILENHFLEKQAAGLSMTELKVLCFVGKVERCIIREICDHLLIPKNNMTAIINKLYRKGLVNRERSEENRRVVYISLTETGKVIYHEEMQNTLELAEGMLSRLNESEQQHLLTLINKIVG